MNNSDAMALAKGSLDASWLNEFRFEKFINQGSYGGVYEVINNITNEKFAVKITHRQQYIKQGICNEHDARRKMCREFNLLAGKQHAHIVNVHEALETQLDVSQVKSLLKSIANSEDRTAKLVKSYLKYWARGGELYALFIRMELCGVTLRQWIETSDEQGPGLWEVQITVIRGILDGLGFLHNNKILHLDIKSENIFFALGSNPYHTKIGDFGIGKVIHSAESKTSELTMKPTTTPLYRAPELDTGEYTLQADLYSLGLVLYEVIKRLKYDDRSAAFDRIKHEGVKSCLTNEPYQNAVAVINQLIKSDPKNRLKAVGEVQLTSAGVIMLESRQYSAEEFAEIVSNHKVVIGNLGARTVVAGESLELLCDNPVIRNIVFRCDVIIKGNNNSLFNISFNSEKKRKIRLEIRGSDNILNDININCPYLAVGIEGSRNTVLNVKLENRKHAFIRFHVRSGTGHMIQNILCKCNVRFACSTNACRVENVVNCGSYDWFYLFGKNHIFTKVKCADLKVAGIGHKFVNCTGNILKSPDSHYEFDNCLLNIKNSRM